MKRDYEHKHAVLDAIAIVVLAIAPLAERSSSVFFAVCWFAAIALAAVIVMSDSPLGLAKMVPPEAHHAVETSLGAGIVFSALLFGVVGMRLAEVILLAVGIVLIGAGLHALVFEGRRVTQAHSTARPGTDHRVQ